MIFKYLKRLTLVALSSSMLFGVTAQLHAEDDIIAETFLEEVEEETVTLQDGMEIYPNLKGSEFEEVQIGDPNALGDNMGGPLEDEMDSRAYPSGGPYVGNFTGNGNSTVYVFTTSNGGAANTYVNNGLESGVFPILDEANNRYKVAISGVIGWVPKGNVKLTKFNPDTIAHDYYQVVSGELIHYITTNPTGLWYAKVTQGDAPSYLGSGQYMSWDGHYFYPATYTGFNNLIKDYNAGNRNNSVNKNDPYYNYFQWLPARSQTNLNASDLRRYLTANGFNNSYKSRLYETEQIFLNNGAYYGGNAALGFATGVHESGWGQKIGFGPSRNNFFGHNAYDSSPGMASAYATPNFGIGVHFGRFWNWNYLNTNRAAYNNGGSVGNKQNGMNVKYASDPYWGEKIAAHYYNMDKLAGQKDYKRYTIGLFTAAEVNIRKDANTNSAVVDNNKLAGMPIAIIEQKTGTNVGGNSTWYGYSSDAMLDSNKNILNINSSNNPSGLPYNIKNSTLYVHSSYIKIVSKGKNSTLMNQPSVTLDKTPTISKTGKTVYTLDNLSLRPDPSTNYSSILTIPKNTKLTGYLTDNGWAQVLYDGHLGYVSTNYISYSQGGKPIGGGGTVDPDPKPDPELPKPGNTKMYATGNDLRVRKEPNTNSAILAVLAAGEEVLAGQPVNGWVHAKYKGIEGYISAQYLTTTKPGTGYQKGDVNGDGKVSSVDYMMIKNYIMGRGSLTADQQKRADVDGDGKITSRDYMMVKNIIMGR